MVKVGQLIANRFVLGEFIAQGGMGAVYHGLDRQSGQPVAIKLIRPELVDATLISRFEREGETLRALNHRNIVKLLSAVQQDDQHYLIMEYVGGGSLADLLSKQPTATIEQTVFIALELADALVQAHHLKIIHRDLKPGNVLLAEDGTPRLSDFGVASTALDSVTSAEMITGTLGYLAPELLNGKLADTRTDIWAFGVLLFEMLAGQLPFTGETSSAILSAIMTQRTPDLETIRPETPIGLVDLINRMLHKEHAQRIGSMRQIAADLEAIREKRKADGGVVRQSLPITQVSDAATYPITLATAPVLQRGNLPTQPTLFVGRETELAELSKLLSDPVVRLITILGPGGMGKTRLALEAAAAQSTAFIDGLFFVSLAPLTDPSLIISTIAEAIGLQFYQSRTPKQQLLDYFHDKRLLLVLDNFEHMLDGVGLVSDILSTAARVKILATSRERLNFQSETLFRIEGMDFPDWKTPEEAADYSAVKLFLQSVRRVQPSFVLSNDNLIDVARICRAVQGMPLGILLAAAWIDQLPLTEIAAEIARSADFLETEQRDVPARQRSIRAVFDSSWRLLSADEQSVFRQLSVFRGGFTREAAQTVAGASLRTLGALINKSLLRREAGGRYEIHELLRQYAERQLVQADQVEQAGRAHSHFYLTYVATRQADLIGRRQRAALRELDAELDNIRVAWGWAVTQRDAVPIDTALDSLYMFYFYRMEYEELTKLLTAARAQRMPAADGQPDWLWYRLDSRCLPAVPLPGGDGLDAWQVHLESGLAVAQAQGWPTEVAYYEARLALMYRDAQNIPDAIAHCQRSIASAKTAEQWSLVALMIHELAYLWAITGAIEQALHTEQESLAVSRSTGSDLDMVNALHNVAAWSLWIGQYKQAEVYFRESVALGDPGDFHYVFGMGSLGLLMFAYGEIKQAIDIAGHIRLIPDIHDPKGRALQLLMSGVADVCTGKFQEGLNFGTRAAVAAGDLFLIIYSDFLMCMAEWGLADDEALLTGMRVGIQKCQAVKNPLLEILFWAFLPVLLHHKKRTEEAVGLVAAIDALHAETLGWTHYWPTYAQFRVVLNQALAPEAFRAAQERGAARGLMSILAAMQTDPLFTTAPASTSAV